MARFASVFLVFALLLLAGCKDESRSGLIALAGRLFVFNPRMATATAVITVDVLIAVPAGSTLELSFENPAGGAALVMVQAVRVDKKRMDFETEPLLCIKKAKRYAFTLTLKDANQQVLQTLDSSLESTLDQSVLPTAPLVEGPGYDPNPAANSAEAGAAMRQRAANCPA